MPERHPGGGLHSLVGAKFALQRFSTEGMFTRVLKNINHNDNNNNLRQFFEERKMLG
jgi:hypothetical protein